MGSTWGLDYGSTVSVVAEYILNAIKSADEIKVTKMFYVIPCEFGSIMYPRNGGCVRFHLNGGRLSSKSFDEFLKSVMLYYYWLCKVKFEPDKYPKHKDKHVTEIQKKLENEPYSIVITSKHEIEFYIKKFKQDPKDYVKISARGKNIIKAKLFTEYLKTCGFIEVTKNEDSVILSGVPQYQVILRRDDVKTLERLGRNEVDTNHINTCTAKSHTEPIAYDPFGNWGDYDPKKIRWKLVNRYD